MHENILRQLCCLIELKKRNKNARDIKYGGDGSSRKK